MLHKCTKGSVSEAGIRLPARLLWAGVLSLSIPGGGEASLAKTKHQTVLLFEPQVEMLQTAPLKPGGAEGESEGCAGRRATFLALGGGKEGNTPRPTPGPPSRGPPDTCQLSPRQARHSASW